MTKRRKQRSKNGQANLIPLLKKKIPEIRILKQIEIKTNIQLWVCNYYKTLLYLVMMKKH